LLLKSNLKITLRARFSIVEKEARRRRGSYYDLCGNTTELGASNIDSYLALA
jgi:hypothetical protein